MQSSPVSFGAATGFSLRYDADKSRLLGELRDIAGVHVPDRGARTQRYCGADHAREIRANGGTRFAVALRSRGNPYYLFLTRVDGAGVCAFVDRKVQDGHFYPRVILAHMCFDERAFDGTVIEGDLLRMGGGDPPPGPPPGGGGGGGGGPSHWVFVCTDLLADRGVDLKASGDRLDDRLARLSRLLSPTSHRPDLATDVCLMRATRYFSVSQLRDVVERQLATGMIDYEVNGIVFRPTGPIGEDSGGDVVFSLPRSQAAVDAADQRRRRHLREGGAAGAMPHDASDGGDGGTDYDYYGCKEEIADEGTAEGVVGTDDDKHDQRAFYIRRTEMPDVYELYDTAVAAALGGGAQIAGVPTLRDSTTLRDAQAGVPLMFSFNPRFGKWVPSAV